MPKKSNKTEHVLSLLTNTEAMNKRSNGKAYDDVLAKNLEEQESDKAPKFSRTPEVKPFSKKPVNIVIHQKDDGSSDFLSSLINKNLETELKKDLKELDEKKNPISENEKINQENKIIKTAENNLTKIDEIFAKLPIEDDEDFYGDDFDEDEFYTRDNIETFEALKEESENEDLELKDFKNESENENLKLKDFKNESENAASKEVTKEDATKKFIEEYKKGNRQDKNLKEIVDERLNFKHKNIAENIRNHHTWTTDTNQKEIAVQNTTTKQKIFETQNTTTKQTMFVDQKKVEPKEKISTDKEAIRDIIEIPDELIQKLMIKKNQSNADTKSKITGEILKSGSVEKKDRSETFKFENFDNKNLK